MKLIVVVFCLNFVHFFCLSFLSLLYKIHDLKIFK